MEIQLTEAASDLVVVMGGTRYPLRRPKIKSVMKMEKDIKNPDLSKLEVVGDFLLGIGLPKEVYEELDTEQCEKIVTAVCSPELKKN